MKSRSNDGQHPAKAMRASLELPESTSEPSHARIETLQSLGGLFGRLARLSWTQDDSENRLKRPSWTSLSLHQLNSKITNMKRPEGEGSSVIELIEEKDIKFKLFES